MPKGTKERKRPVPKRPDKGSNHKSLNKYAVALLVLILAMIIFYSFSFYQNDAPLRKSGGDAYAHLGLLRETRKSLGMKEHLTEDMFPDIYSENLRQGVNYVFMAVISGLPGSSNLFALYIFGLIGIILFLSGIYCLTLKLSGSPRAAFLAALLSLIICGYDTLTHGNSFTLVELLVTAHYASIQAMGLAMFALVLNIRYMEKGGWKLYAGQVLLSLIIFNIHILTGIEYFVILLILVAIYAFKDRRLSRIHLKLITIIPITLLLASLWPYYHWWSIFELNPMGTGEKGQRFASFSNFLELNLMYIIGLPFLINGKRERLFLLAWALVFALVSVSFILPIRISLFWRFANVMRIPLVIGLALGLGVDLWQMSKRRLAATGIILVITLSFVGVSIWRTVLRYQELMQKNAYAQVEAFPPYSEGGVNLIAHPSPGYNLMGVSSYNLVSVLSGHGPRDLVQERNDGLRDAYATPDPELWRGLLEEYDAEQVLFMRSDYFKNTELLLNGVRLERNPLYELYKVDADNLDTETWQRTPDPELEESSVQYGFTRFDHWADIQNTGDEEITLEVVRDEGRTYLKTISTEPIGLLFFLSRGFIEVDPQRYYDISVTSRETGGEPANYFVLYEYSQPDPMTMITTHGIRFYEIIPHWITRELVAGPPVGEAVNIQFNQDTRYVKIGMLLFQESVGEVDIDLIEISPRD